MADEVTTLSELSLGDRFELLDGRYKIRIWTVTERLSAYKLCACVADNGKTTKLSFRQRVSRINPTTDREPMPKPDTAKVLRMIAAELDRSDLANDFRPLSTRQLANILEKVANRIGCEQIEKPPPTEASGD